MNTSAISHLIEYYRLELTRNEAQAINHWAGQFLRRREAGLLADCHQLLQGVKGSGLTLSPRSRAVITHCQGLLALTTEDVAAAEADFQRSLALFAQINDAAGQGRVANDLATLYYHRGDLTAAVEMSQIALHHLLPGQAGQTEEAMIRNNLGLALVGLGRLVEGSRELERAADVYRQLHRPEQAARVEVNLGQVAHRQGQVEQAEQFYRRALATLESEPDQRTTMLALNSLGVLERYRGRLDEATAYHQRSLTLAQTLNDLANQALALGNLGAVFQLENRLDQAESCYQQALACYETVEDQPGQTQMWTNLGHVHSLRHQLKDALTCQQTSLAVSRATGDAAAITAALLNVANVYRDLHQPDAAEPHYQQGLELARQLGSPRLEDKALGGLGTLRMSQQRWAEAADLLEQALALQQQRRDVLAQVETIYKLGWLAYEQNRFGEVLPIISPAWELAQQYDYGRWQFELLQLAGHAALAQNDPGAINYYATAVLVAYQYEDNRNLQEGLSSILDRLTATLKDGKIEAALEVCHYLTEFWANPGWQPWAAPLTAYINQVAAAIRAQQPFPEFLAADC